MCCFMTFFVLFQQILTDRHIQMQLDERDFLRETANDILQRVCDLEKRVRKETGDHGWQSALTKEPNWYPDLGAPSIWCTSPTLNIEGFQLLLQRLNSCLDTIADQINDDVPSTSETEENSKFADLVNAGQGTKV